MKKLNQTSPGEEFTVLEPLFSSSDYHLHYIIRSFIKTFDIMYTPSPWERAFLIGREW